MAGLKIIAFSGSLRKGSYNTALLHNAQKLAPSDMTIEIAEIGDLPLYNADHDTPNPAPASAERLRKQIKAADALLFACTEYNFSVSGVMKNAIDWASRPASDSSLNGKPCAILGAAGGPLGTGRAQYHLRQICVFNNMFPINKPEVFVGMAAQKFDENLNLKDDMAKDLIKQLLTNLAAWTRKLQA
jgi:chromate reductase